MSRRVNQATKFVIRTIESSIIVGFLIGLDVIQIFLRNPYEFLEAIYAEIYRAGNLGLFIILMIILYVTDADASILKKVSELLK